MNDPQFPFGSTPADQPALTLESLLAAHQSLRRSFHLALVMLLILSGSLFVFFLRELSLARRQVQELAQVVSDYEKNTFPIMENFRSKLQAFAQTHPDFNPIYAKYFGAPTGSAMPGGSKLRPTSNASPARLPPTGNR